MGILVIGSSIAIGLLHCAGCKKIEILEDKKRVASKSEVSEPIPKEREILPAPMLAQVTEVSKEEALEKPSQVELWQIIVKEAGIDFSSALKLIDSSYVGMESRNHAYSLLVETLCAEKLDNLAIYLKKIDSVDGRRQSLGIVATNWAKRDPLKLVNYALQNLEGKEKNSAVMSGVNSLIRAQKVDDVSKIIEAMPFSKERSWAIHQLAPSYGRKDLLAALSWADGLPLDEDRSDAYRQLLPTVSEQQGAIGLTDLANRLKDDDLRKSCITLAVNKLALQDNLDDAMKWSKQLPVRERAWAELELVRTAADRDLNGWTKYVVENISKEAQGQAIVSIAQKQFSKSPSAAANWTLTLPQNLQHDAVVIITNEWYNTDSIALSEWISTLKAGPTRDSSLRVLASRLGDSDKSAALEVASKITDVKRRNDALNEVRKR